MRIKSFKIENFRNLKYVECNNVPNFVVICGRNGCGKSALLEALITAKEIVGSYGFSIDNMCVSADADIAKISLTLEFDEKEQIFVREKLNQNLLPEELLRVEINKGGRSQPIGVSQAARVLLRHYSTEHDYKPGFFDYINVERRIKKFKINTLDTSALSDQNTKETLVINERKFENTKRYLAALTFKDLATLQKSYINNSPIYLDSLKNIKTFFNEMFKPMNFEGVKVFESPYKFSITTPLGEIDIDDLSSGEKEILNIFVRFHQLKPEKSIILLDEADVHLHPELQRRYFKYLKDLSQSNQVFLTTHSPEMMIATSFDSLFSLKKYNPEENVNQLQKVSENEELHNALSILLGSRGIISFNEKIVFIEGTEASVDIDIYEKLYPLEENNISFVAAGNSYFIGQTADRINLLLESPVTFQQYFCIIDGDFDRNIPTNNSRLFKLPVYHVENFLLDENLILEITTEFLRRKCRYNTPDEILEELKNLVLSDQHVIKYTSAMSYAKLENLAHKAKHAIHNRDDSFANLQIPDFASLIQEARLILEESVNNNTWKSLSVGRKLLKLYCNKLNIPYRIFKNSLISKMENSPADLDDIINRIKNLN